MRYKYRIICIIIRRRSETATEVPLKKKGLTAIFALALALVCALGFTACAKDKTFTLTMVNGSGTETVEAEAGSTPRLPEPSRTGYAFKGWFENEDGTGEKFTVMPEKDVTVHAVFTANAYTVVFDGSGGTGSMEAANAVYDAELTLPANSFARAHYEFAGWSLTAGGGVDYAAGAAVKNLAASGEVTLYAVWTGDPYTIEYNANGGTGTVAATAARYGETITLAKNAFTKAGRTFAGWATEPDGGAVYADEAAVVSLVDTKNGTVVLYAVWEYTLAEFTFAGDGILTGYTGNDNILTVPEEAKAIAAGAFRNADLRIVHMGNNVVSIGEGAFEGCIDLLYMYFDPAAKLERIGVNAFNNTGLLSITFPASLAEIGADAFYNCADLTEMTFLGQVPTLGNTFAGEELTYRIDKDSQQAFKEAVIAAGIGKGTILWLDDDKTPYIGKYVKSAAGAADEIYYIGGGNVGLWQNADGFTVCEAYTAGFFRFYEYDASSHPIDVTVGLLNASSKTFAAYKPDEKGYVVVDHVLYDYIGKTEVLVFADYKPVIQKVAPYAVYGNQYIRMVHFNDEITEIGDWAFGSCTLLNAVFMGENIDYIGDSAFFYCMTLDELNFKSSTPPSYIGEQAFFGMSSGMIVPLAWYTSIGHMDILTPTYVSSWNSAYMDAFNAHNTYLDENGETVDFYGTAEFAMTDSTAGKTYKVDDSVSFYSGGGMWLYRITEAGGETTYNYATKTTVDAEKVTYRITTMVYNGIDPEAPYEAVKIFGKFDNDADPKTFIVRDDIFGSFAADTYTVKLDGYGGANVVIGDRSYSGAYTMRGNEISFTIDGLAVSATAVQNGDAVSLNATIDGNEVTLDYVSEETGTYYDFTNMAKLVLDGKGVGKITIMGVDYEFTYTYDKNKSSDNIKVTCAALGLNEKTISFSKKAAKVSGYFDNNYDTNYTFVSDISGEDLQEPKTYTAANGDTLLLDGYFTATYTPNGGASEKRMYKKFASVGGAVPSILLYNEDATSYTLYNLEGASFKEGQREAGKPFGVYYVVGSYSYYELIMDGKGNLIYDTYKGTYTYEGGVLSVTLRGGTKTDRAEGCFYDAANDIVFFNFDYAGNNFSAATRDKAASTSSSGKTTFPNDETTYDIYVVGESIFFKNSSVGYAYYGAIVSAENTKIPEKGEDTATQDAVIYKFTLSDGTAATYTPSYYDWGIVGSVTYDA